MASVEEVSPAELRKRRLKEKSEERMAKIMNTYGAEPGEHHQNVYLRRFVFLESEQP